MIAENLVLPEYVINNPRLNVYERLDALEDCYKDIVKMSAINRLGELNYRVRQELVNLRELRRQFPALEDFLEKMFFSFDEKLLRLCIKFDGEGFVKQVYLPE
jgi:hypothetical protein